MAYLTINGVTVPVVQGGHGNIIEIGSRDRAVDGTSIVSVSARKRTWRLTTRPMTSTEVAALVGLLLGYGDSWDCEWAATLALWYSKKGIPSNASPKASLLGASVDGVGIAGHYKFGPAPSTNKHGLGVTAGTTNLLTASVSTPTSTTGFTAVDSATRTYNTTAKCFGTGSIKVVTSATVNHAKGGVSTTFSANTGYYTVSCYVRSDSAVAGVSIEATGSGVYFVGSDGQVSGTTLPANSPWTRLSYTVYVDASTTVTIKVLEITEDSHITFYVDGLQAEAQETLTAWIPGGTTRAAASLYWPLDATFNADEITFGCWTTGPTVNANLLTSTIIGIGGAAGVVPGIAISGAYDNILQVTVFGPAGSALYQIVNCTNPDPPWNTGDFRHIACVYRRVPAAGQYAIEVYLDGVLVGHAASITIAAPTVLSTLGFPEDPDVDYFVGSNSIDEMFVLPYAATPVQIAALAAATATQPVPPRLTVSGDIVRNSPVVCAAVIEDTTNIPHASAGVWQNNAESVVFTLSEV